MKLTPGQARNKIRAELNKGNGVYIDSRFFDVRVKGGVLQLSDFNSWFDVKPGDVIRNGHGNDMFAYEPVEPVKTLTVVSCVEVENKEWAERFEVGETAEVVRETETKYVISPFGSDVKVDKATLRMCGFRKKTGVTFKVSDVPGPEVTESNIQSFIAGYLTAALWSSSDTLPGEDEEHSGEVVQLDQYEWAEGQAHNLGEESRDFINYASVDLLAYAEQRMFDPSHGNVWEHAGHDYWLTRNGHGAGFWDRGLGELGERLTEAAKTFGSIDLYLGDNLKVYAATMEDPAKFAIIQGYSGNKEGAEVRYDATQGEYVVRFFRPHAQLPNMTVHKDGDEYRTSDRQEALDKAKEAAQ